MAFHSFPPTSFMSEGYKDYQISRSERHLIILCIFGQVSNIYIIYKYIYILYIYIFFNPHLRTFFFIAFRERGREEGNESNIEERKKHQLVGCHLCGPDRGS